MTETPDHPVATDWLRTARVRVAESNGLTVVRLRGLSPFVAFVSSLIGAGVALAFAYPITAGLYQPNPVPVALVIISGAVALALAMAIAKRRRFVIESGREDLLIDDERETLALPWTLGRRGEVLVPFDRVTEIAFATAAPVSMGPLSSEPSAQYYRAPVSPEDDAPPEDQRSRMMFGVLVCWIDDAGTEIEMPIVRWSDLARTRALTLWLRERLTGRVNPAGS